jgi:hypothetical protein
MHRLGIVPQCLLYGTTAVHLETFPAITQKSAVRKWLTKWLTNQVETGGFNSDTICLNTL